jgi:hypothetical protein
MTYTENRLGIAFLPLLVTAATEGFRAYTTYQEGENQEQQSRSNIGEIDAMIARARATGSVAPTSDKTPLYLAAGGAALLVLLTAMS